jgi:1-deoxy-D-xylulose-5-phosphate synthase
VVAVIGDGAMSAGMAYEAMNNAGATHAADRHPQRQRHVDRTAVGRMSAYLSRLISSELLSRVRHIAKQMARAFPKPFEQAAKRAEEFARGIRTGGTLFEELGFYYVGPIDGITWTISCRSAQCACCRASGRSWCMSSPQGPWLSAAEALEDKYHGVTNSTSSPARRTRRRRGRRANQSLCAKR